MDDNLVYLLASNSSRNYYQKEGEYTDKKVSTLVCYSFIDFTGNETFRTIVDCIVRQDMIPYSPNQIIENFDNPICEGYYCPYQEKYIFSDKAKEAYEKGYVTLSDEKAIQRFATAAINRSTSFSYKDITYPIKILKKGPSNLRFPFNSSTMPKLFVK